MIDTDSRTDAVPESGASCNPSSLAIAPMKQVRTGRPPFNEGRTKAWMGPDVRCSPLHYRLRGGLDFRGDQALRDAQPRVSIVERFDQSARRPT